MQKLALFLTALQLASATFLSLHNSANDLTVISSVNVTSNRLIVESTNIMGSSIINTLTKLHDGGIAVLCCVRYKSVPEDQDGALANFSSFVSSVGPLIHALVLGNEPDQEYDSNAKQVDPATGVINAVAWITRLAQTADSVRTQRGLNFLLVNPEPNIRYNTVNGWSCKAGSWPGQLMSVTATTTTLLPTLSTGGGQGSVVDMRQDVHLHMEDLPTLSKAVSKVQACTSVGLLTTEWSQAPVVTTSGWLKDTCSLNASISNGDFLNACYHSPVSLSVWNSFVGTAPYDSEFMADALALFTAQNFSAAAYGGGFQYGNPSFDTKQLYASLTVNPNLTSSSGPGPTFWALASELAAEAKQVAAAGPAAAAAAGEGGDSHLATDGTVFFGGAREEEEESGREEGAREEGGGYTYAELDAMATEPLRSWFVALAQANPVAPPNPPT
mmetsp:Transcript_82075/g.163991  ORF Transcript_82075/g.163991 Transcript_82075/m.163991 type:complete len:443 (-) Transcript_82075:196-1524(-)